MKKQLIRKKKQAPRRERMWRDFRKSGMANGDFTTKQVVGMAFSMLGYDLWEWPTPEIEKDVREGVRQDVKDVILQRKENGHRIFYSFPIKGQPDGIYRHRDLCTPNEKRDFADRHGAKGKPYIEEARWIKEQADMEEKAGLIVHRNNVVNLK